MDKRKFKQTVVGYFLAGDKVLLGFKKESSWGLGESLFVGIGGKVGDKTEYINETTESALIREAEEEIGVLVRSYTEVGQLTFIFNNKPNWNQQVSVYLVTHWSGSPIEGNEIKPYWFDVQSLPLDKMWDDAKYWLPEILDGKKVKAKFIYGDDNEKVIEKEIKIID